MYYIYIDIDKILIALKAKHNVKVINVKLRIIWKNDLRIQTTCISSDHDQNTSEVPKESI